MAQKEVLSKEKIRFYLDTLIERFNLSEPVSEKALTILFSTNLFGECVKEIKDKMRISCILNVLTYEDHVFPDKGAAASITTSDNIPIYGTKSFDNYRLTLNLTKSLRKNYHRFVYCVAHEMSHVVLYSTRQDLRYSEVATDLFVMVCGFENIMAQSRTKESHLGYLDHEHFIYAQKYLAKIRKKRKILAFVKKVRIFIKNIFKRAP
jgi:predicted SprT family Zn-dependent metalloprotease